MRVAGQGKLRCFWQRHPDAEGWLTKWYAVVKAAQWRSLLDVRSVYRYTDSVKVESGNTATVFNVCGSKYRMAVAIRYDIQWLVVLWLGTHAEYSKDAWKGRL